MKINIFLCALLISFSLSGQAQADTAEKFIGTWFLESIEARSENGEWQTDAGIGPEPFGVIMYDSAGNMAVQIARRDRSIPDPENVDPNIINGYVAYAGTYELDTQAGTVTHHKVVHINPNLGNQSGVRYYQLDGDSLILTVAPHKKVRLRWKRHQ